MYIYIIKGHPVGEGVREDPPLPPHGQRRLPILLLVLLLLLVLVVVVALASVLVLLV